MTKRFVLAQISDTHIRSETRDDGFDPAADLTRAFAQIASYGVDAIIATGDLANDARPAEYAQFADLVADAPAPLFLVAGNHDSANLIRHTFPRHGYLPPEGPLSYVIDDYPVRLVGIDQTVSSETYGDFTQAHAAWLEAELAAAPAKPTIIALHHPPMRTHDVLLDTIALKHAERFEGVIRRHAQVGLIICGHHHRPVIGRVAHAPAIVCPSTAWTFTLAFKPGDPLAKREAAMKGWALHIWDHEAGFASHFIGL
ncbi:MAG: metallophosphoesterase [Pseudomonadota bacterium]